MSDKGKAHTKHLSGPPGMHSLETRENSWFRAALEFSVLKKKKITA